MSDYDLPPISTLSSALVDESHSSLHIAPELLDDTSHHNNNQDATQPNHEQDWNPGQWPDIGTSTGTDTNNNHNNGHGHQVNHEQQSEETGQPPRKKARAPRRHANGPMNHADFAIYLNEAVNAEYEDPGRDYRAGAVFTYPPSGSNQACMRCHQIKRKCDNARPRCATCSKSDMPCIFEMSPATAGFVTNLKNEHFNTTGQLQVVQQRVLELESLLGSAATSHTNDHHAAFGQNDAASSVFANTISETDYTGFAQHLLGMDVEPESSFTQETPLPATSIAQHAANAFFEANVSTSMFINRAELMVDLEDTWAPSTRNRVGKRSEFLVFMITSVGAHMGEVAGTMPAGTSEGLRQRAMRLFPQAVAKKDLISVQAYLALLSSVHYGLHPDISPFHVLALAMQTAISLNLHRKPETTAPADIELRNRIWWTIYCDDRSLSAGLGRPLGIPDSFITADLPTPNSPAEKIKIALLNALISHRKLMGRLWTNMSTTSGSDNDTISEAEIYGWRSMAPAIGNGSDAAADLLEAQLVCLSVRPTELGQNFQSEDIRKLRSATERSIAHLAENRFPKRQSPDPVRKANDLHSTIWRLQLCISHLFAYCYSEGDESSSSSSSQAVDQVKTCRAIVDSCELQTKETKPLKAAFESLERYIIRKYGADSAHTYVGGKEPVEIMRGMYIAQGVKEEEAGDVRVYDQERLKSLSDGFGDAGQIKWDHML